MATPPQAPVMAGAARLSGSRTIEVVFRRVPWPAIIAGAEVLDDGAGAAISEAKALAGRFHSVEVNYAKGSLTFCA
jgi:hypothetical protein